MIVYLRLLMCCGVHWGIHVQKAISHHSFFV